MSLAFEGDVPFLWLTDEKSAEVVKTTLDGRVILSLQRPDIPVVSRGHGVDPDLGNGQRRTLRWQRRYLGHRRIREQLSSTAITEAGAYVASINGTEGKAGSF